MADETPTADDYASVTPVPESLRSRNTDHAARGVLVDRDDLGHRRQVVAAESKAAAVP
jgi:hypothetical protein